MKVTRLVWPFRSRGRRMPKTSLSKYVGRFVPQVQLHRHTPFGPFCAWYEPLPFPAKMYLGDLHHEHVVPKPRIRGSRCAIALSILLTFVIICICHQLLEPVDQASIHASRSIQFDPHARHPEKVAAVVQYDSPDRISLLDCYLKVPFFHAHSNSHD